MPDALSSPSLPEPVSAGVDKASKFSSLVSGTYSVILLLVMIVGWGIRVEIALTGLQNYQAANAANVANIAKQDERLRIVEYQNQISINDRADLHARMDKEADVLSQINEHLARLETELQQMVQKTR